MHDERLARVLLSMGATHDVVCDPIGAIINILEAYHEAFGPWPGQPVPITEESSGSLTRDMLENLEHEIRAGMYGGLPAQAEPRRCLVCDGSGVVSVERDEIMRATLKQVEHTKKLFGETVAQGLVKMTTHVCQCDQKGKKP